MSQPKSFVEERRQADLAAIDAPLAVNATPQTLRKLHRSAITELWSKGDIDDDQVKAAAEIERVFIAITASLFSRARREAGSVFAARNEWPAMLMESYVRRYVPWRDWAGARSLGHRSTLADLTLLAAVDNHSPHQIGKRLGMHHATALRHLQISLRRYAEIAGWF